MEDLIGRLTSDPPPEAPYWRDFVHSYFLKWPPAKKVELYTMPSANAALGYPRQFGGHVTGVQHLVLLGFAVNKKACSMSVPTIREDPDGMYLQRLSHHLRHNLRGDEGAIEKYLFAGAWDELEKTLPGAGAFLQQYLRLGVTYVLDRLDYIPILPIAAEERGLKTRFPTCSLTAVNLVQQILRRVIDSSMIRDPRFAEALGGTRGIDLRGERGPWESQDCTAATDYHPEWLTRTVYEELADICPQLSPYRKYFGLLFGPKKLLLGERPPSEYAPLDLLEKFPRAPLLDPKFIPGIMGYKDGYADPIIKYWDHWLSSIKSWSGTLTTTGQMMGDPTSFPPLMLVSLCAAEQTLLEIPYTRIESRRRHPGLKRGEVVLKGIGDDAVVPRWTMRRRVLYHQKLEELAAVVSKPKSFWHKVRALIAENPLESGFDVPYWPLSVLVAPPGGSKGAVTWYSQVESFGNDPSRPVKRIPKFFWKLSPFYYTWQLARRLGLPIAAPVSYGGIGLPIYPAASLTSHVQWLTYLSEAPLEKLIVGLGIGPLGSSRESLLDKAASGWLKEVLAARTQWEREGLELLSHCALDDAAELRVSIGDAYRTAVGRLRSVEFYFRAPPELTESRAPSVRKAAGRFNRMVRSKYVRKTAKSPSYASTKRDLERKTQLFFARSGGFLPDPWDRTLPGFYGLETSGVVKRRWKAPWIQGLG
jgi:hypothetical protein